MLKINISKVSEKFLLRTPAKHAKQISHKILQLSDNPHPQDAKLLKGYSFMRVDSGEYRIIYRIDLNILYIELIGKRNDDEINKKLKRKIP